MSRTGPKGSHSAFTLIELIVVLFALVILAAAVIPSMRGAGREHDLDDLTARVMASARYARETAASRGVSIDLTVDPTTGLVRLVPEQDTTNGGSPFSPGPSGGAFGGTPSPQVLLPTRYAQVPLPPGIAAHLEPPPVDPMSPPPLTGTTTSPLAVSADALRFPADAPCPGGVIVLTDARGRERRILVAPRTAQVGMDRSQ